jgi:hypothetical protein
LNDSSFDNRPYKITKWLIWSFVGAFIFVMIFNENLLKDIAAIWGAWIGAAIGYFFGSRPTETILHSLMESVDQRKKDLEEEKRQSAVENVELLKKILDCDHDLTRAKSEIQILDDRYQKARNEIINISNNYKNKIDDSSLITRLKYEYIDNKT